MSRLKLRRIAWPLAAVPLILLAFATTTVAQEEEEGPPVTADGREIPRQITNERCQRCHDDAEEPENGYIPNDDFLASIHGEIHCVDCHESSFDNIRHPRRGEIGPVALESCAHCHEEPVEEFLASDHHAELPGAPGCGECHGDSHFAVANTDRASPVHPLNLTGTCGGCHLETAELQVAASAETPPDPFLDSVHGQALLDAGLAVAPTCASCHGSHAVLGPADPTSRVHRLQVAETCGECHVKPAEEFVASAHAVALTDADKDAPNCQNCHDSHAITATDDGFKVDSPDTCGSCHEELLATFEKSIHGKATALGAAVAAQCSDCHGNHAVLGADDPGSMIHPANLVETCGTCHQGATANFVQFIPHADAHDRENYPLVYWTRLAMEALIIGVFLFFGLHTFLWLIRSLIERRRKAPTGEQA